MFLQKRCLQLGIQIEITLVAKLGLLVREGIQRLDCIIPVVKPNILYPFLDLLEVTTNKSLKLNLYHLIVKTTKCKLPIVTP